MNAKKLIENSQTPLVNIDNEGKITHMNQALALITGITKEELQGTDFFAYFTDPLKAREIHDQIFIADSIADTLLTLRHKTGKLTNVLISKSKHRNDLGNFMGELMVVRDVSEQKWATELLNANKELAFQNDEKEKRAAELVIANKELAFQNTEKEKRAAELVIANRELLLQNEVKEKRASELIIANKELAFQNTEKEKRAAELVIADKEIDFQNTEKEKLEAANRDLEAFSNSVKLASQYSLSLIEAQP